MLMAEITNIIKSGKDKYSIYLDNSFYCFLNAETIIKSNIKIGQIIEKQDIDNAQFENEKLVAFDKALKYLSAIKSEKQIKDYLYSKGYTSKIVNYVIEKLKSYNYLNDELYAKTYISNYQMKKGKRLLAFELETKGISKDIINNLLENFDEDEEIIKTLAEKYLKNKPRDAKTAKKLANHLFTKGYSFEKINKIIKQYFYNFDEMEGD